MSKIPPPPKPPLDNSHHLQELANYYRSLVDYYDKAKIFAATQLSYVEALLEPVFDEDVSIDIKSSVESSSKEGTSSLTRSEDPSITPENREPALLETSESENNNHDLTDTEDFTFPEVRQNEVFFPSQTFSLADEISEDQYEEELEDEEEFLNSSDFQETSENSNLITQLNDSEDIFTSSSLDLISEIETLLEHNRGKVLHIDYIIRKLYGLISPEELQKRSVSTLSILREGEDLGKWYEMPDSPNCWTIDIKEFPDLINRTEKLEISQGYQYLTTATVSQQLKMSKTWIIDKAKAYPNELREGIHYYRNPQGYYFWNETGIAVLEELLLRKTNKKLKPSQIPLLEPYEALSLLSAVKKVFDLFPEEIFNCDALVPLLYGDLSKPVAKVARNNLIKTLSQGKMKGLWERVPRKTGYYRAIKTN
ncbi:hypothetical protein PCC7424_4611 [Gloeothece citriformis PCC 7424]|uniref:Uncharacterized protein n=1 Tax=Gloeothece citriformis (strain PCC 7424) TaxID=65393 RepID=B7KBJ5_GLOC7|nr:hypothetical protein [Gloeothece citriformis]ACK72973.1 hypothetical protein PCC7424_4611 [Gloeothece citriformis PCC 7424]